MNDPLQLMPNGEEKPKMVITPRKGRTVKEAERDLKKFNAKYIKASAMTGLAGFGQFIIEKGTKASGIGLMVYAANSAKNSVESCDDLIAAVEDPELRVRLQENKVKLIEQVGKMGQALANVDDGTTPTKTDKQPGVVVFPANCQIAVRGVVDDPTKELRSAAPINERSHDEEKEESHRHGEG